MRRCGKPLTSLPHFPPIWGPFDKRIAIRTVREAGLKPQHCLCECALARRCDCAARAHKGEASCWRAGRACSHPNCGSQPHRCWRYQRHRRIGGIGVKNGMVEIGALTPRTWSVLPTSPKHAPPDRAGDAHIAHPAIRKPAPPLGCTSPICGIRRPNCPPAGACARWRDRYRRGGPKGKRRVKACGFLKVLFETATGPHDVPQRHADFLGRRRNTPAVGFAELARRHGDYGWWDWRPVAKASGQGIERCGSFIFGCRCDPVRAARPRRAGRRG